MDPVMVPPVDALTPLIARAIARSGAPWTLYAPLAARLRALVTRDPHLRALYAAACESPQPAAGAAR